MDENIHFESHGKYLDQERLNRYYRQFEQTIKEWDEKVGDFREKYGLLKAVPLKTSLRLVRAGPMVLHLLISLLNHEEVTKKTKRKLALAVGYFIFPLDALPEGVIGPIGYLDDIVIGLMLVDSLLNGKNEEENAIINDLWQGSPEELTALRTLVKGIDVMRHLGKYIKKIVPGAG